MLKPHRPPNASLMCNSPAWRSSCQVQSEVLASNAFEVIIMIIIRGKSNRHDQTALVQSTSSCWGVGMYTSDRKSTEITLLLSAGQGIMMDLNAKCISLRDKSCLRDS